MDYEQATPSLSQAQRMKKFSQEGKLSEDVMLAIMSEDCLLYTSIVRCHILKRQHSLNIQISGPSD